MIGSYLGESVVLKIADIDEYQVKTFVEKKAKAFIERRQKWTKNQQGAQILSQALVLLAPRTLTLDDRIEFDNRTWSILSIARQKVFSTEYLEVNVG